MWIVYVIQCEDKSFYTGITTDIQRRFTEHLKRKGGRYTRSHRPEKVIYTENRLNRSEALKREDQIKGWSREKKIQILKLDL